MAKKRKQKSLKELFTSDMSEISYADVSGVLQTDVTTHSLMALAVFGLFVSTFATSLLGAQFVMAAGTTLGQTQDAAAVVLAMDDLMNSNGMQGNMMHGDDRRIASGTPMGGHPGNMGSTTQSCTPLLIARTLMRGSKGDDVSNLQTMLVNQGLLASSSSTGFFGALTEKAVAKWQAQQGVASSSDPDQSKGVGMVGPRTRALFAKCEGRVGQMLSNGSKSMDFDHGSSTMPMPPRMDNDHGSSTMPMHMPMMPAGQGSTTGSMPPQTTNGPGSTNIQH